MLSKTQRKAQIAVIHREAIIDAAQALFFDKGYEQTTIDDIAANTEYSRRTLYKYIASKEEIYDEVALRGYKLFLATLTQASEEYEDNPVLGLRAVLEGALRFAYAESGYFNIILNYHIRAMDFNLDNPLHKNIDQYDQRILEILRVLIVQGIEQKIFRQNIHPAFMAVHLISMHIGMVTMLFQKRHYLEQSLKISTTEFIQQTMESTLYTLFADPHLIPEDIAPITFWQE